MPALSGNAISFGIAGALLAARGGEDQDPTMIRITAARSPAAPEAPDPSVSNLSGDEGDTAVGYSLP
jgi:hypothetical protein